MSGILQMVAAYKSGAGPSRPGPNALHPIFACGFECGQLGAVGQHWQTNNGSPSFDTGTVRTGSRSLKLTATAGQVQALCTLSAQTVMVIRFYIHFTTLPGASTYLAYVSDTPGRVGIGYNTSTGKLECGTGATPTFAGGGVSVTTGIWYRIDLKLDQTSGAKTANAQVDGTAVTQASNADTGAVGQFIVGNRTNTTLTYYVDDLVISATAADYPWGAGSVQHFVPVTPDGSHNITNAGDFTVGAGGANITNSTTDSYQYVDDVPLNGTTPTAGDFIAQTNDTGGGSEYVEHLFGPAPGISTPTAGPRAVEVIIGRHQASTGTGNSTAKLNDNGTESAYDSFSAAGTTGLKYGRAHYANAPSDSNAWGVAAGAGNFNNLKHRWGYSTDANPDQYFDCVMIEAEFA